MPVVDEGASDPSAVAPPDGEPGSTGAASKKRKKVRAPARPRTSWPLRHLLHPSALGLSLAYLQNNGTTHPVAVAAARDPGTDSILSGARSYRLRSRLQHRPPPHTPVREPPSTSPDQHLHQPAKPWGLSLISNRQRRKEGTLSASELAGIGPTPARPGRAGYARLNLSATGGMH
jgi:hypothetical protein